MAIAVVDSGGANISSVLHALRRLGADPLFTSDAAEIRRADRVILPGVGAAGRAMESLRNGGLVEVLCGLNQPVLGICLGMQLLFESSEEDDTDMLRIIQGRVGRLTQTEGLRIPHMGWSSVKFEQADHLDGRWFYFVHSFAAPVGPSTLAYAEHGESFSAVVGHRNFFGVQFHPERSASAGAQLLRRFLESGQPCN